MPGSKTVKVVDKDKDKTVGAYRGKTSVGCSGWDLGQKKALDKNR